MYHNAALVNRLRKWFQNQLNMKEKLRLVTVLKIKEDLETSIEATYSEILKLSRDSKQDAEVDSLFEKLEKLENQLIVVKEVVQDANRRRHTRSIRTNNYYIYKYSNLLAKKRFYNKISKSETATKITYETAKEKVKQIFTELENVRNKLSNFNLRKRVTVDLDESLNLSTV